PGLKVTGVFFVIAAFVLLGLWMLFRMLTEMATAGMGDDVIKAVVTGGSLTIGVVTLLLFRQLSRGVTVARKQAERVAKSEQPAFIEVQSHPPLAAPTDPIRNAVESPSVAEHTTRQMAGVYRESATRE